MTNVAIRNNEFKGSSDVTTYIYIIAKNMYCQRSEFYNIQNGIQLYILGIVGVENEIVVLNNTFENSSGSFLAIYYDQFNQTHIGQGSALIANNIIKNNYCLDTTSCIYISFYLHCANYFLKHVRCKNRFAVTYTNNTFVGNIGHDSSYISAFINWAILRIENSEIVGNKIAYAFYIVKEESLDLDYYNISIHDITFDNNRISSFATADKATVMLVHNYNMYHHSYEMSTVTMSNLRFTNNVGTPLSLVGSTIDISGDLIFINNTNALTGGGLYISDDTIINVTNNASITFTDNQAFFGGAIYVRQGSCFLGGNYGKSFKLNKNHARYGPDVFSVYTWCDHNNSYCEILPKNIDIIGPITVNLNLSSSSIRIFPGQIILLDMTVTDCLNNSHQSCLARVHFDKTESRNFSDYELQGPSTISLYDGLVKTGLTVTTIDELLEQDSFLLQFACKFFIDASITVNVTLIRCPLGFNYNSSSKQCDCPSIPNNEYFICSKEVGLACVKKGYWYSSTKSVIQCTSTDYFCDFSDTRSTCPSTVSIDSANFVALNGSQCVNGHGGTLCTGCADDKVPTYGAFMCIHKSKCSYWQPYILLLLSIILPFINGIFLIVVVRLKLSIGSGYLYGPLFYLATLNLIPLGSYSTLNGIASPVATILLLQYQSLGLIPWCFFEHISLFYGKLFDFLAPSVVAVVLLLTIFLARARPKLFGWFQKSPLQAMCLLMLVSFWSLASTAILLLKPVIIDGKRKVRLNPDRNYFTHEHIPVGILSILLLLIMYSMVILLMISRFYNPFHKFKPVLDELQSCYKDRYRWYGGVYFIIWTILQIIALNSKYQLFKTSIIILTITHCLLQPYSKKWLNLIDGVFLGSLSITSSLVLEDSNTNVTNDELTKVLLYISLLGPLTIIVCGIVLIITVQFGIIPKVANIIHKISAIKQSVTPKHEQTVPKRNITESIINLDDFATNISNDREPMLQESIPSSDYAAVND